MGNDQTWGSSRLAALMALIILARLLASNAPAAAFLAEMVAIVATRSSSNQPSLCNDCDDGSIQWHITNTVEMDVIASSYDRMFTIS